MQMVEDYGEKDLIHKIPFQSSICSYQERCAYKSRLFCRGVLKLFHSLGQFEGENKHLYITAVKS
jgi:hypothetical protein